MAATGILFGALLLLLAFTGLIDRIAKLFTKPVVRGVQLGLGFMLMTKGVNFIRDKELLMNNSGDKVIIDGIPVNLIVGIGGVILVLLLLNSRKLPAALALVSAGIITGIAFGAFNDTPWDFGPTHVDLYSPGINDYVTALWLLIIPQIPLTIGNAVIGTTDTAKMLFGTGDITRRVTNRALCY